MAQAEAKAEGGSGWRAVARLRRFVLPHWKALGLALTFMIGEAVTKLLRPWPLKFTFDSILKHKHLQGNVVYLVVGTAAALVLIIVLDGCLVYLSALVLNRTGRTIAFDLRTAVFEHIQRLSLQFHNRKSTGELLTRVTTDVKALRDVFTESLTEVLTNGLFVLGMLVVLLCLDWQLALVVLAAAPVLLVALLHYTARIKQYSQAERAREGDLASVVHEALATVRLSRVFNQEEETKKRFQEQSAAGLDSGLAATMTGERFGWLLDVLAAVAAAATLGFGVQRIMAGAMTPGTLIVFVHYVNNLYRPLRTAVKYANKINRAAARAERVADLLDLKEGVNDRPGARPAPVLSGRIEFRNVTFAYEPDRPVLHRINLAVEPGQVVALVGPTGSGKSTLASLIPRLYDPAEGTVLVDGHDVREYTLQSLRGQTSVVLQESVLQPASITENIAYGRPGASFEAIVAAARAANAHEFIMALPQGYASEVGERGETLSGGQRQRIAIARAMIRNAPILILDEPLTGLDAGAAASVMEALERLMKGKTVFIISHQLAIVRRADRLVVLEDGRIAQEGAHGDLVEREGRYRQLYQAQFHDVLLPQS
ncbi:MAG TPA: ABC transporter ATP-binding protein [Gemmataceae bacterium]|jgi:ABC-type multidrug transport system fused ATPase/permease subunit|nr:ABC transporter ATP-binding protein [Gemmataceae bacterium]